MQIVFASANENKVRELNAIIPSQYRIVGLKDVGITEEIPEPGKTIKENAFLKAQYVSKFLSGKNRAEIVFADDSGLEVFALNNAPGVHSARYAGLPKNDFKNNQKLFDELRDVKDRSAQFITVICLIVNNEEYYFEGVIKGQITTVAKGDNGFGYDPLFIPDGYDKTFAELSSGTKNKISHRSIAGTKFVAFLNNLKEKES